MARLLNTKSILITVFVAAVLLGATQLVLANEMSTEGQRIRDLEEQKAALQNEITGLEKEVAASRRLEQITFGDAKAHLFRSEVEVRAGGGRVV